MKNILRAAKPFAAEIWNDFMLMACAVGPILMGVVFKFLLPLLERVLCAELGRTEIIAPYYSAFDLLLSAMTPVMFSFSGMLAILGENDCGVTKYFAVTPVGRGGYLASRLVLPAVLGFFYSAAVLAIFTVSGMGLAMNLMLSFGGALTAVIISLLVVSLAKNKMEGMALVKLSGLMIIGIPAAYFVAQPVRYVLAFLPSFWLAELCLRGNALYMLPAVFTSMALIAILYGRYRKKLL